jgi:YD repeat-containing protein
VQQSGAGAADKRVDFAYNALGQPTQVTRYGGLGTGNPVVTANYSYDLANRLTGLSYQHGSTTLAACSWAYDNANRITSQTSPDGPASFGYDAGGELTSASNPGSTYSYDQAGNRTGGGYQTGPYNRLLSDGRYDYAYDNEGNRTKRTDTVTGPPTSTAGTTATG